MQGDPNVARRGSKMYLIDTDTVIYHLKGVKNVVEAFAAHAASPMAISVITYGELVYGAWKSAHPTHNLPKLRRLAELIPVIEVTRGVMDTFGSLKAELEKAGKMLDDFDLMIAATAMMHGYTLVTNNRRYFSRIPGLPVESWS